jgi:crotonobetainyl-CoA:carnitine CoA-transferase CaiB-like acyl-CoA transferase
MTAAMSIGFALLHRERTGEGQYIECSLIDTYFNMHEVNIPKSSLRGSSFAPKRTSSLHPDGGPTGVFRYRGEEFIAIMVMPYQWNQMIKVMNMPELADDPRFGTPRARRDNKVALKHIIEGWLGGFPSREALMHELDRRGRVKRQVRRGGPVPRSATRRGCSPAAPAAPSRPGADRGDG